MKYIVIALNGKEDIFIFPKEVDHNRMADACLALKFGPDRDFVRKYRQGAVVAAGFIECGRCYGRSESLGIESRGAQDTALLDAMS